MYLESLTDPSSRLLWRLYGPNGFMGVGSMPGDLGRRVLRDGGSYRIEVFSDETDTGAFGFEVHAVPVVPARAIEVGDTISGTIGAVGERHEYTFTAADGTAIAPTGEGGCVEGLEWRLLASDGRVSRWPRPAATSGNKRSRPARTRSRWAARAQPPATTGSPFVAVRSRSDQVRGVGRRCRHAGWRRAPPTIGR